MYRYFISLCLLLLPVLGVAQQADTVIQQLPAEAATPAEPFRLQGLRVGVDLKPWIQGIASSERDFQNLHLRLDAGPGTTLRYGASLDWTSSKASLSSDSTAYTHDGHALRLGVYLNVIPGDPDVNLVTIGVGYGRSWFDETLRGYVIDEAYGDFEVDRSSTGLRGGWLEISGGMQARIWKQFYTGYNLTLKLLPHFKDDELLQIYEIPGFGRASENSAFGFSYYLLYRIPFRR